MLSVFQLFPYRYLTFLVIIWNILCFRNITMSHNHMLVCSTVKKNLEKLFSVFFFVWGGYQLSHRMFSNFPFSNLTSLINHFCFVQYVVQTKNGSKLLFPISKLNLTFLYDNKEKLIDKRFENLNNFQDILNVKMKKISLVKQQIV